MKIGELAQRTGMAPSAIRFYESSGLLPPAERGANGYRQYGEAALQRLQMIQLGQRLGFGLDQLREVFAVDRGEQRHELILGGLDARLAQIDQLMADLARQRAETIALHAQLSADWAAGRCFMPGEADKEKAA